MDERLIDLYAQIAAHTWALCDQGCPRADTAPTRCCFDAQCEVVESGIRKRGLPVPERVGEVRFLGPGGCVIPPHQRPVCSIYHCKVSNIGPYQQSKEWLDRYFDLKARIREMER